VQRGPALLDCDLVDRLVRAVDEIEVVAGDEGQLACVAHGRQIDQWASASDPLESG
jgi:hypothetical protein